MDEKTYLLDWAYHFFKSRDSVQRRLSEIKQAKDHLTLIHKDGNHTLVYAGHDITGITEMTKGKKAVGVFFNTGDNLTELYERWDTLTTENTLTLYFINPLSKNEPYWVIRPAIHTRIADPSSLKQGLKSMSSNVDTISQRQIKTLINSRGSSS